MDNKINILYITNTLKVGGAEIQLRNLLKYLDRGKFNPFVCALKGGELLEKEIRDLNIPIFILNKSVLNFTVLFDLIKIVKHNQINIIHGSLFASNFWGRLAGIFTGAKIIASERSAYKNPRLIIFDRLLARFTDKIICNSEAVKNFQIQKEKIAPQKLKVIYNGLDIEKFDASIAKARENRLNYRKQLGVRENEFLIGNICSIVWEKNLEIWLKTAKLLLDKKNNLKFIIVGGAIAETKSKNIYRGEIIRLIENMNIQDKIIMAGFSNDTTKELAIMDMFFQSSVIEGFPNAVMEAMAAGLPVAATPAGGTPELIKNNENGIILGNGAEIMAEQILDFINNPEKLKNAGKNARLTIENNFAAEKLARNTEKIYEEILK